MIVEKVAPNSEFTFGVHSSVLSTVAPDNAFTMFPPTVMAEKLLALDAGVMGSVRALNKSLELLRQAIDYGLVIRIHQGKVLFAVYRRNKKNNEGGLVSVLSIGVGGHVEVVDVEEYILEGTDVLNSGVISFDETLEASGSRERAQEIRVFTKEGITVSLHDIAKIGFVLDSKPEPGYVGNIHFGVVSLYLAHNDGVEFEMLEPQNDTIGWATADELLNAAQTYPGETFEPWAQLIIAQIKDLEQFVLETLGRTKGDAPAIQLGELDLTQGNTSGFEDAPATTAAAVAELRAGGFEAGAPALTEELPSDEEVKDPLPADDKPADADPAAGEGSDKPAETADPVTEIGKLEL